METEFEAKFYPVNKEEYREKLKSIGAKLTIPERKMRRYIADFRANPQIKSTNIRIRDEGHGVVRLSAKIDGTMEAGIDGQKEADVEIADFDKAKEIMEIAGLNFNRYQETLREEWDYEGSQITIDTWPGLLTYSEIEADSGESVKKIADLIGFNWDKKLTVSAADIYIKVYGIKEDEVLEKISNITFENNPFSGLKQIWSNE